MKSIIEMNTLPRDRFMGWQFRIEEIDSADEAQTRDLARHHFLIALHEYIGEIRSALAKHGHFVKMPKAERHVIDAQDVLDAARAVFGSFKIMDRLEPAEKAVEKLAGGSLPPDLREVQRQYWQVLHDAEGLRQRFYSPTISPAERLSIDLSEDLGPRCEELQRLLTAFYEIARARYGLPEIKIWGRQ